jgi:hypothetical protein
MSCVSALSPDNINRVSAGRDEIGIIGARPGRTVAVRQSHVRLPLGVGDRWGAEKQGGKGEKDE